MSKWFALLFITILLIIINFPSMSTRLISVINTVKQLSQQNVRVKMTFLTIPKGCFKMAANKAHDTCLDSFFISETEVTQYQWQSLMGDNPSFFEYCGTNCPVEEISWQLAQLFIKKLNQETGENYRLPTEEEWEYACRGGEADQKYCGSNDIDMVAWYEKNSNITTHPVKQKKANAFGLYDMSGNVREWVAQTPDDDRDLRVMRGGCWNDQPYFINVDYRYKHQMISHSRYLGFRLAKDN